MPEPDTTNTSERHGGIPVDHARQLPRLRRIEGQVRGLHQMIENERSCIDVAHLIEAVIAALRRVEADMLKDHLQALVKAVASGELTTEERDRLADEISRLISKIG